MEALAEFVRLEPWGDKPKPQPPPQRWWMCAKNSYSNREYGPVDTIVIHATSGSTTAGAMSVSFEGKASWHAAISGPKDPGHKQYIYRCVPDDKKAWHVLRRVEHPIDGKTDINSRSYGIEVVNEQDGDAHHFSDWQVRVTAQLVNYFRAASPSIAFYLYTHAFLDPDRKLDPGTIFPWDTFMSYIKEGEYKSMKVMFENKEIHCNALLEGDKTRVNIRELVEGLGGKLEVKDNQIKIVME